MREKESERDGQHLNVQRING